jgi:hypothetical protein
LIAALLVAGAACTGCQSQSSHPKADGLTVDEFVELAKQWKLREHGGHAVLANKKKYFYDHYGEPQKISRSPADFVIQQTYLLYQCKDGKAIVSCSTHEWEVDGTILFVDVFRDDGKIVPLEQNWYPYH